jgi:hypothetical protein
MAQFSFGPNHTSGVIKPVQISMAPKRTATHKICAPNAMGFDGSALRSPDAEQIRETGWEEF